MKKSILLLLVALLIFGLAACGQTDSNADNSEPAQRDITESVAEEPVAESEESTAPAEDTFESENGTNILVVYFSRSGNTGKVAQEIQSQTGGDLFELVLAEPYPEDYNETVERWKQEQEDDARPELVVEVENMEDYDIIFFGYPIWNSTLPSPNRTFLEQYDFSGKAIIPFCTHGGSRFGNSVDVIEELAPGATIAEGFETSGNSADDCAAEVTQWLQELGVTE